MNIETDDYIVCSNPRRLPWQKKRMKWLVVGYYWQDEDAPAAMTAAKRRANHVAKHLTELPVETIIHQRQNWFDEEHEDDSYED
jgi:hypothetical protein